MTRVRVTRIAAALAAVIAANRRKRGWTILKLSQRAGMNVSHLSVLESGKNTFNVYTMFMLCDALDMRPSELLRQAEEQLGMQ